MKIAHWKLNDNAANTTVADFTGNYPGVCSVNTDTISVAGKIDRALDMNSANRRVVVGAVSETIKTISLWFSFDTSQSSDKKFLGLDGQTSAGTAGVDGTTDTIELKADFTASTVYVDAVEATLIPDTGFHMVTIVDTAGLTLTDFRFGDSAAIGHFNGTMDNVMLFDNVLSASQIRTLYRDGVVPFFRSRYSGNSAFRLLRRRFSPNSSF